MFSEYLERKKTEPYKIISSTRQITIPIDTAREIKRKTSLRQNAGIKRIILFYQMEKMLAASADSLLKLIEEPPPDTIIILTANDPESLLPTIQSRAQKIPFRAIERSEIARYLEEKYSVPDEKAEFFARLSDGSMGRAINYIVDEEETSLRQTSFLLFKSLFVKDNPSAVATFSEMINPNNRGELEEILGLWQSFLSDLILIKYGGDRLELVNTDLKPELEALASRISLPEDFTQMLEYLRNSLLFLRRNVHIRPAVAALALRVRRHIHQSP